MKQRYRITSILRSYKPRKNKKKGEIRSKGSYYMYHTKRGAIPEKDIKESSTKKIDSAAQNLTKYRLNKLLLNNPTES